MDSRAAVLYLFPVLALAQPVHIRVDAARTSGPVRPFFRYFGYDEPNYTYMQYGKKLVRELADLSHEPVYIRTHFMLATGDGTASFKFGSTNAYTEDGEGKPMYDWKIVDRIIDTYLEAGARPFVEIGFMPKALSVKPDPYQETWTPGAPNRGYSAGWSYPPKDYDKWSELIYQWVKHSVDKYGRAAVESWYWEVWNEPDISYWHGTPDEYNKLYDSAAKGLKRALPTAKIGGPATTGPSSQRAAEYLRQFLDHCEKTGVPLDFITYHAKGAPSASSGHVRMGIAKNANDVARGMEIVASFPKFSKLQIILSESDPEGCAACSARVYPQNAYRNGPLYAVYTAAMMDNIAKLADRTNTNLEGMLTWAFEFEGQPYFDGFRTLATNGIDKPVLNVFRMAGLMEGQRVAAESDASFSLDQILKEGVREKPYIGAMAARAERKVAVMAWNYHDDDLPGPAADVQMSIAGVSARRVMLRHYRIDQNHSNAYAVWKEMGSPQQPTPEQYAKLEAAGQLELLESPRWVNSARGSVDVQFSLPRQGVSLLELTWN
jgi:xylan 1,4-beta-xylosidase